MYQLGMNTQRMRSVTGAMVLGLVLLLGATPATAGNGTFDNGVYDFCVSVRFDATAAELTQIRTAFENASQIFADATDGQQRFGTITLVNDSGASQSADYWVHAGNGRANATLGRYGERGQHVNLYFQDNFQGIPAVDGDAYTIAHEHAHHAFGVADEYSGPGVASADCAAPGSPDSATLSYSLMDNYFTRGGNAQTPMTGYTLNEFCVASNHDPDGDTHQENIHGESAWETIASHPKRAATAPAGLPTDAPPAAHSVTFEDGIAGLRVMLLVDRSGSMNSQNRIDFAKSGGRVFVDGLRNDDEVGVASFSCSTGVDFPLTEVATGAAGAKAAIDALTASGSTNIGGGLLAALGALTSQTDRSCNEIIVLLSDGDHNCGTAPGAVIPQLQQEGVTVLSVGVGGGISTTGQATLQSVATATGGRYFRVASASELTGLYLQLVAESTGAGLLTQAPFLIGSNEQVEHPALVEQGAEMATFALALAESTDELAFSVISPSGMVIDESVAAIDPNVDFFAEDNSQVLVVRQPEGGVWHLVAESGKVADGGIELLAFAESPGVSLLLALADDTPTYPELSMVEATPIFGGLPVVGAEVYGRVVRPDGSTVEIVLYDDGELAHGDRQEKDGIYTAVFDAYGDDGTYTFEITTATDRARVVDGEALFGNSPPNGMMVPAFTRSASIAAVLNGSPGVATATVEYMPEPLSFAARGRYLEAYIELPQGLDPADIDPSTVMLSQIDGAEVGPISISGAGQLGDFDNDGIMDLKVRFDKEVLRPLLPPGVHDVRLEGRVDGQLFVGERTLDIFLEP